MSELLQSTQAYIATLDEQTLLLAVLFAAVLLMVLGGVGLVATRDPISRRLAHGTTAGVQMDGIPLDSVYQRDGGKKDGIQRFWTPKNKEDESRVRSQLFRAGYRRRSAVQTYYTIRVVFGLIIPIAVGLMLPLISRNIAIETVIFVTCGLILVGFYFPVFWVVRQAQRRQDAIRDGFPDALDMLLVCVESGLGLDAALDRVAQEVRPGHPIISDELVLCGLELRAGKQRLEVLRSLAKRVEVDDVRSFVAVLTQSDRYGTSMSEAIRTYASEMRQKRILRAEEKANKLPVKLALGAIMFTLPPVFLVMISPALISVMNFLNVLTE